MDYEERCYAMEHIRKVRRRYLARAARSGIRSLRHAMRTHEDTTRLVIGIVVVISAALWVLPRTI